LHFLHRHAAARRGILRHGGCFRFVCPGKIRGTGPTAFAFAAAGFGDRIHAATR
jgi:hypothetical protein